MGWLKMNAKNRVVMEVWDKFWRLTFIEEIRVWNRRNWIFQCDCWNIKNARLCYVKKWNTNSCWCYWKEMVLKSHTTHWLSKHRLFWIYNWILNRCNRKETDSYDRYWGRGIKCEWNSFEDFLSDMEDSYIEWLTIDRINSDGNYCKSNCRWATMKEQTRNRRSNIFVWDMCLMDYCNLHNLKYVTIQSRIIRWWSIQEAVNAAIRTK